MQKAAAACPLFFSLCYPENYFHSPLTAACFPLLLLFSPFHKMAFSKKKEKGEKGEKADKALLESQDRSS